MSYQISQEDFVNAYITNLNKRIEELIRQDTIKQTHLDLSTTIIEKLSADINELQTQLDTAALIGPVAPAEHSETF